MFKNKEGYMSRLLRCKEGESASDAIKRLQGEGWMIESSQVVESEDTLGKVLLDKVDQQG